METFEHNKSKGQLPDFDLNCFNIYQCLVTATMDVIGGKWKPVILFLTDKGINHFGKLEGMLKGLGKRRLTKQLRDLERDNVLHREVFAEVPPRVEYSLTDKGYSSLPVIKSLYEWGEIIVKIKRKFLDWMDRLIQQDIMRIYKPLFHRIKNGK